MWLTLLTGLTTTFIRRENIKNSREPILSNTLRLTVFKEFDEAVIKINLSTERSTSCSQMTDLRFHASVNILELTLFNKESFKRHKIFVLMK